MSKYGSLKEHDLCCFDVAFEVLNDAGPQATVIPAGCGHPGQANQAVSVVLVGQHGVSVCIRKTRPLLSDVAHQVSGSKQDKIIFVRSR